MKLYAYTEDGGHICSFDATLEKESFKKVFKKFRKFGYLKNERLRIMKNSEDGIKEAIDALDLAVPTEILVYPDTIEKKEMPYPRRSGLDKVNRFITYYQTEIAVCILPGLYYLIFDDNDNIREDCVENIENYLCGNWNDQITSIFNAISQEEEYLDSFISYDNKMELIRAFLGALNVTLCDVIDSSADSTLESNKADSLNKIVHLINQSKDKKHERKLK